MKRPAMGFASYIAMCAEQEKLAEMGKESQGPSGEAQPVKAHKTTKRNDRCPCGSGRKYKHCCRGKK